MKIKLTFDGHGLNDATVPHVERFATLSNAYKHTAHGEAIAHRIVEAVELYEELVVALNAMLDMQGRRRHPLGQPDEGIAYDMAEAASKARQVLAKVNPVVLQTFLNKIVYGE